MGYLAPPVAVHCPRSDNPRKREILMGSITADRQPVCICMSAAGVRWERCPNMAAKRESQAVSSFRTSDFGSPPNFNYQSETFHFEWVFAVRQV